MTLIIRIYTANICGISLIRFICVLFLLINLNYPFRAKY